MGKITLIVLMLAALNPGADIDVQGNVITMDRLDGSPAVVIEVNEEAPVTIAPDGEEEEAAEADESSVEAAEESSEAEEPSADAEEEAEEASEEAEEETPAEEEAE